MNTSMKKMTCRTLVVSLLALPLHTANAGLIGAGQAAAGSAAADRSLVISVLNRAETTAQLRAQGVDPEMARARIAAMSDHEVQQLAQDIQTAPAGADLSAGGWLLVIAVLAGVWYFAFRR
jgi:hypothetical protein